MAQIGTEVKCDLNSSGVPGSTDQGKQAYVPLIEGDILSVTII